MPEQLTALRPLAPSDLVAALDDISAHDIRLFAGLTPDMLRDRLALTPPVRPVVSLVLGEISTERTIKSALDRIGRALSRLWPFVWGGEDFSDLRDDALSRAHLPIRIAKLADRLPGLHQSLARDLAVRLMQNRSLRLRNAPPAIEWAQLVLALAPAGLTIVVPLPSDDAAAARIGALEWLARHADVGIAVLASRDADLRAFERIGYGARQMATRAAAVEDGFVSPSFHAADAAEQLVVALPPAPEGQPHPTSPVEQRLHKLIQADDELRPLFRFNKTVPLPLLHAKVDLVWLDGRVAVEIDGHDHRAAAKFRADRHRDYELLCAGYRVLRITNDEVETDAALAIEKIRRVARLAREEAR